MTPHFHSLFVKKIAVLTSQAVQVTLAIPPNLRDVFSFKPGQFLTLRAQIAGDWVRRSYSICSTPALLYQSQEINIGIKKVETGVFSNWATTQLQAGDTIEVMPPDGRFTARLTDWPNQLPATSTHKAVHRVAFCAGSGITPVLSILAHCLASEPDSRFTMVYGNQRVGSIMFLEKLQDLKDQYPARLNLVHMLSRQPGESPLLQGRLDEAKITQLLRTVVPATSIDEAFICGPEAMIETTENALFAAGVGREQVHSERFASNKATQNATKSGAAYAVNSGISAGNGKNFSLEVVLDGKTHSMNMGATDNVLDTALQSGLDLPYACKGGVCCTCRAKLVQGQIHMEKNFTLEQWEIDKGFVLTCQARCISAKVVVSYDER